MSEFSVFPDIEAVVASSLRGASISGLSGVYSSLPKNYNRENVALVKRIGGLPSVRQYLDTANLQCEVWGESKSSTRDIAAAARVVIFELEGTDVSDPVDCWISGVEDSLGLTWQPDPETATDRYIFGVNIYFHASRSSDAIIEVNTIGTGGTV